MGVIGAAAYLTTKAVPSDVYPRSGLRYHSEGMRRNEVSTIPLVWCSRVSIYPRMGVALIVGFRSIDWVLTQPPAGGSSIRGTQLRGESLIRFALFAHPLAMLTEPPTGGTNIIWNFTALMFFPSFVVGRSVVIPADEGLLCRNPTAKGFRRTE